MDVERAFKRELDKAGMYGSRVQKFVDLGVRIMSLWRAAQSGNKQEVKKIVSIIIHPGMYLIDGNGQYHSIFWQVQEFVKTLEQLDSTGGYEKAPDLAIQVLRAGTQFTQEQYEKRVYNEQLCCDVRKFVDREMGGLKLSGAYAQGDSIEFSFTDSGRQKISLRHNKVVRYKPFFHIAP